MAIEESNPAVHRLGEVPPTEATSAPVARPLDLHPGRHFPSPRPRPALPQRDPSRGRHWPCDDNRNQVTVEYLVKRYEAEHHNTDIQARLDAAERAS